MRILIRFIATTVVASATLASAACVKDDPTIVGRRDASVEAAPTIAPVVPAPDDPDEDAPDCRHCKETLDTNSARGTLCRKNDPSSTRLLNALVDCLCYDKCIQECGTYCAGALQTDECGGCVIAQCANFYNACLADTVGGGG